MENTVPEFLIELLKKQYTDEEVIKILNGYTSKRKVTLRVNNVKSNIKEIENELENNKIQYTKTEFYEDAFIIKNATEQEIQNMDIYKQGKIYLQSLSSMLPPIILEPKENEDILDMTAAPGGKTTQMASITNNMANITACELNKIRCDRLKYNIEKQGANVFVMQKDSRDINDFFKFDKILLDAPCSGSGTVSVYDENLDNTFTEKLIEKSINAQRKLLNKAIKLLKPGKEMIYSTCSILDKENEDIVNEALKKGNVEIVKLDMKEWSKYLPLLKTKIDGTICVCPTELFEGFFVAKIKKIK